MILWLIVGWLSAIIALFLISKMEAEPELFMVSPKTIALVMGGMFTGWFTFGFLCIGCIMFLSDHKPFLQWFNKPFNKTGDDRE